MKTVRIKYIYSQSGKHRAEARVDGQLFVGYHESVQIAREKMIRNIKKAGYKVKSGITALLAVRGG